MSGDTMSNYLPCVSALVLCSCLFSACNDPVAPPDPPEWAPIECSITEVTSWTTRSMPEPGVWRADTAYRIDSVAVLSAAPEDVTVRVLRAQHDPCASTEDCTLVDDTRLSPDGSLHYYRAGSSVVTGLDTGETRVLCAVTTRSSSSTYTSGVGTVETYNAPTTVLHAHGGEILIRR